MTKTKIAHAVGPLFGLGLFVMALWVLHHELKAFHLHQVVTQWKEFSISDLMPAVLLTCLSYLIMTGYDVLALRYVEHPLPYGKVASASFIGYALSNNMGFAMVAGASVRFRLYSAWGLSAVEIAKVVGFCTLTLWARFPRPGGRSFPRGTHRDPANHPSSFCFRSAARVVFLALVGAYFWLAAWRKKPLKIRGMEFTLPSVKLFAPQVILAVLDWALAGSVLYALLPATKGLTFPVFIGIFMLAQTAGLISQVPGGLGVFETVIILLLSPMLPGDRVIAALLAFRVMYYLLPLGAAVGHARRTGSPLQKGALPEICGGFRSVGVGDRTSSLCLQHFRMRPDSVAIRRDACGNSEIGFVGRPVSPARDRDFTFAGEFDRRSAGDPGKGRPTQAGCRLFRRPSPCWWPESSSPC